MSTLPAPPYRKANGNPLKYKPKNGSSTPKLGPAFGWSPYRGSNRGEAWARCPYSASKSSRRSGSPSWWQQCRGSTTHGWNACARRAPGTAVGVNEGKMVDRQNSLLGKNLRLPLISPSWMQTTSGEMGKNTGAREVGGWGQPTRFGCALCIRTIQFIHNDISFDVLIYNVFTDFPCGL